MSTRIVAYKFKAWSPSDDDVEAFEAQLALKRELWASLAAIHDEYVSRRERVYAEDGGIRAANIRVAAALTKEDKRDAKAALTKARADFRAAGALSGAAAWRVDREREAKQAIAAKGLHYGDYNAVVFQFHGAAAACARRGAKPENFESACGEAIVNQIMDGCSFAKLYSGNQVRIAPADERPRRGRQPKCGSRRAQRRQVKLEITLRGPRHELGPRTLALNVLLHRTPPVSSLIKEVRVMRSPREAIGKDGEVFRKAVWAAVFVAEEQVADRADRSACGVALSWTVDEDMGALIAIVASDSRIREIFMPPDHIAAWDRRAEMFRDAGDDERALAESRIFERRLFGRRQLFHREQAKEIAGAHAVIALQKIDLARKGVKNHTSPAKFRDALIQAVAARGGRIIEVACDRYTCHACGCKHKAAATERVACGCGATWRSAVNLAKILRKAAKDEAIKAVFSAPESPIIEEAQADAA